LIFNENSQENKFRLKNHTSRTPAIKYHRSNPYLKPPKPEYILKSSKERRTSPTSYKQAHSITSLQTTKNRQQNNAFAKTNSASGSDLLKSKVKRAVHSEFSAWASSLFSPRLATKEKEADEVALSRSKQSVGWKGRNEMDREGGRDRRDLDGLREKGRMARIGI